MGQRSQNTTTTTLRSHSLLLNHTPIPSCNQIPTTRHKRQDQRPLLEQTREGCFRKSVAEFSKRSDIFFELHQASSSSVCSAWYVHDANLHYYQSRASKQACMHACIHSSRRCSVSSISYHRLSILTRATCVSIGSTGILAVCHCRARITWLHRRRDRRPPRSISSYSVDQLTSIILLQETSSSNSPSLLLVSRRCKIDGNTTRSARNVSAQKTISYKRLYQTVSAVSMERLSWDIHHVLCDLETLPGA